MNNEKVQYIGEVNCEECLEDYFFLVSINNQNHEIGLKVILTCLEMADKYGIVPKIDDDWWSEVATRFN